jgi:hypothetical protein
MHHINTETARERLRALHRVRLVQPTEEGTAAGELPDGVFGFTGSPGLAAPLFAVRRYRNFEIHHRLDGVVAIVGFAHPRDVSRLAHVCEPFDITIYPEAEGEATEIVAISYTQIAQHRQYSVRNAPGMSLRVKPAMGLVPDSAPLAAPGHEDAQRTSQQDAQRN